MTSISEDAFVPLGDAFKFVYQSSKIPAASTIKNWIDVGINGVRLPAVPTSSSRYARYRITPKVLREWIATVSATRLPKNTAVRWMSEQGAVEDTLKEIDEL